jgi:hypothetical protein
VHCVCERQIPARCCGRDPVRSCAAHSARPYPQKSLSCCQSGQKSVKFAYLIWLECGVSPRIYGGFARHGWLRCALLATDLICHQTCIAQWLMDRPLTQGLQASNLNGAFPRESSDRPEKHVQPIGAIGRGWGFGTTGKRVGGALWPGRLPRHGGRHERATYAAA